MSHLYEAAVQTGVVAAIGPVVTIAAGAAQCEVREICVTVPVQLTTATDIQVGRPAAAGTGAATGSLVQAADITDVAGLTTIATTFATTQPTAPAVAMRQWRNTSLSQKPGVVWWWEPGELVIPPSGQLVLWQLTASSGTFDVFVKVAE